MSVSVHPFSFQKIPTYLAVGCVLTGIIGLPLLLLPTGENLFLDSKLILFFFITLGITAAYLLQTFLHRSVKIASSRILIPVFLLLITGFLSSFLTRENPVGELLGWGGMIICYALVILLSPVFIPKKLALQLPIVITGVTLLLSVESLLERIGGGASQFFNFFFNTQFQASPLFNLMGSPLVTFELTLLAIAGISVLLWHSDHKTKPAQVGKIGLVLVVVAALLVQAITLFEHKNEIVFLSFSSSLEIAKKVLFSSPVQFLLGAGPNHYLDSFLLYRSHTLNMMNDWNMSFSQARNVPLTLFTTFGVLGGGTWLLALGLVIFTSIKTWHELQLRPLTVMVLLNFILQILFPLQPALFMFQSLLLSCWIVAQAPKFIEIRALPVTVPLFRKQKPWQQHLAPARFIPAGSVIGLIIVTIVAYALIRFSLAQGLMFQSLVSALNQTPVKTYDLQKKAITLHPYISSYWQQYSQTNLILAYTITNSPQASAEDKQNVPGLLKQAVDKAKTAVALHPSEASWVNLGKVYENLIGTADGSAEWAIQAYTQAEKLSPSNPTLPLQIGSVYFQTQQYTAARDAFQQAVALKPDWANAHYNLANANRQLKDYTFAKASYEATLKYLEPGSPQAIQVEKDLATMVEEQNSGSSATTSSVKAAPTPAPKK